MIPPIVFHDGAGRMSGGGGTTSQARGSCVGSLEKVRGGIHTRYCIVLGGRAAPPVALAA